MYQSFQFKTTLILAYNISLCSVAKKQVYAILKNAEAYHPAQFSTLGSVTVIHSTFLHLSLFSY
jgi:hypothetical protein